MNDYTCACGYEAATAEELGDHIGEMVVPPDDIAPDGQTHAEAVGDKRGAGPAGLRCLCGFTGTGPDLDEHLLRAFIPVDKVGLDGARHAPVSSAS